MSFAVDSYCMQCYLKRNVDLARTLGSEKQATEFAKEIMKLFLAAPKGVSAPWFGPSVAQLLHQMYGLPIDRFHDEKIASNQFVLQRLEQVRQRIWQAQDPILAGLQYAILGNYLDFSALQGKVSYEKLTEMLEGARDIDVTGPYFDRFKKDLETAETLLYLTDNAGEIGMDRLFAEALQEQYPRLKITFCVRGCVTANDATREDAAAVGIPFEIIDNGNQVAGTELTLLGEEASHALQIADVILAKGMGNTETMFGCGYNVYYAFLIKCPRFERMFRKPMLTPMFIPDSYHMEGGDSHP